jgi:hypothetical protein
MGRRRGLEIGPETQRALRRVPMCDRGWNLRFYIDTQASNVANTVFAVLPTLQGLAEQRKQVAKGFPFSNEPFARCSFQGSSRIANPIWATARTPIPFSGSLGPRALKRARTPCREERGTYKRRVAPLRRMCVDRGLGLRVATGFTIIRIIYEDSFSRRSREITNGKRRLVK